MNIMSCFFHQFELIALKNCHWCCFTDNTKILDSTVKGFIDIVLIFAIKILQPEHTTFCSVIICNKLST